MKDIWRIDMDFEYEGYRYNILVEGNIVEQKGNRIIEVDGVRIFTDDDVLAITRLSFDFAKQVLKEHYDFDVDTKIIRYDLRSAYEAGATDHPQKEVKKLGMKIHRFQGEPMGDCVFMEVSNVPDRLPTYLTFPAYYEFSSE